MRFPVHTPEVAGEYPACYPRSCPAHVLDPQYDEGGRGAGPAPTAAGASLVRKHLSGLIGK